MPPPQGYHEVAPPKASAPPSGYHEVAPPQSMGASPTTSAQAQAPSAPLDINQAVKNRMAGVGPSITSALDTMSKWADTPLLPQELQSKYQIGPINPAAGMSTPRNLAIGALGAAGGGGLATDAAMFGLTAPEIAQGTRDIRTPGKRLKGAGEVAFAGIPGLGALSHMGADLATVGGIKLGGSTIAEMSHNWLFNSARESKQFLGQTKQGVEAHVGMLKNGLETADQAAIPQGQMGSINLTSIAPEIDRIAQKYKGKLDIPLDKFDRAVDSFSKISGRSPYVNLETLLDIRTGIGKLWHSARDSMDAAAVSELRDALTDLAKDRAKQLGQSKQFDSYNKVWRNLLEYEDQGVLGKLLNSPSGKPYFDLLNDKSLGPRLRQLNRDLSEQAGTTPSGQQVFPKDYFKTLAADHQDIYDFTNRRQDIRGVFSGITQRPMAAIPGALAGMAGGGAIGHPILGGMLGSSMSLSLADRLAAIRNMSKLGGAKGVEGLMGPRVEPDFGGGLSGQVIKNLEEGPKGGGAAKPDKLVSTPEEIRKMQEEDREGKFVPGGEGRKYGKDAGKYGLGKGPPDKEAQAKSVFEEGRTAFRQRQGREPDQGEQDDLWKMARDYVYGENPEATELRESPTIRSKAEEVERLRAERAKRVGDTTKEAVKQKQTGTLEGYKPNDDSAKQQAQLDVIKQYLSDLKKGDPSKVGENVEELRKAIQKRKNKK